MGLKGQPMESGPRMGIRKYPSRPVAALGGIPRAVYLDKASKIRPSISASIGPRHTQFRPPYRPRREPAC